LIIFATNRGQFEGIGLALSVLSFQIIIEILKGYKKNKLRNIQKKKSMFVGLHPFLPKALSVRSTPVKSFQT